MMFAKERRRRDAALACLKAEKDQIDVLIKRIKGLEESLSRLESEEKDAKDDAVAAREKHRQLMDSAKEAEARLNNVRAACEQRQSEVQELMKKRDSLARSASEHLVELKSIGV